LKEAGNRAIADALHEVKALGKNASADAQDKVMAFSDHLDAETRSAISAALGQSRSRFSLIWCLIAVILLLVIAAALLNNISKAPTPAAVRSPADAQPQHTDLTPGPLVGTLAAQPNGDGMTISGTMRGIPAGTKMWVQIIHEPGGPVKPISGPQDDSVIVGSDGKFQANIRNSKGAPFKPGTYRLKVTSFFNRGWQAADVLRRAGVELDSRGRSSIKTNPKAIPESPDFKPDDPEFPKESRHLEAIREVNLGAVSADLAAIAAVKSATLIVQGKGRSSLPVGKSVDWFQSAGGFKPIAWSAVAGSNGDWIVTLSCVDGGKEKKAQWSYDDKSKRVKYLDPLAKTLSYVPPD
jgi:hypothetical protein